MVGPHVRVLSLEGELPVDLVFGSANGNPIRRQEYRPQEFLFLWTYGEVRIKKDKKKKRKKYRSSEEWRTRGRDVDGGGGCVGGGMEALLGTCIIKRRALFLLDSTTVGADRGSLENGKKEKKHISKEKETLQRGR